MKRSEFLRASVAGLMVAGLPRREMSAERNAAMGLQISEGKARYGDGQGRGLDLEIAPADLVAVSGAITGSISRRS